MEFIIPVDDDWLLQKINLLPLWAATNDASPRDNISFLFIILSIKNCKESIKKKIFWKDLRASVAGLCSPSCLPQQLVTEEESEESTIITQSYPRY